MRHHPNHYPESVRFQPTITQPVGRANSTILSSIYKVNDISCFWVFVQLQTISQGFLYPHLHTYLPQYIMHFRLLILGASLPLILAAPTQVGTEIAVREENKEVSIAAREVSGKERYA